LDRRDHVPPQSPWPGAAVVRGERRPASQQAVGRPLGLAERAEPLEEIEADRAHQDLRDVEEDFGAAKTDAERERLGRPRAAEGSTDS
jgi:hypothetical protein